jgi:dihydrofolate reductase
MHYVFSRQPPASATVGVQFVSEPIKAFAERIRNGSGKNVWLMGGGEIIGAFLDEGAIDEFIVSIIPIFIGEGIPLLVPRHREVPLHLTSARPFSDGVVQLRYQVRQSNA